MLAEQDWLAPADQQMKLGDLRRSAEHQLVLERVSFTFGHRTADGHPLLPVQVGQAADELAATLCALFRGAQISWHAGTYRRVDGSLLSEPATTVWAFGSNITAHMARLREAAARVGRLLEQDSVLLTFEEIPGSVHFVTPFSSHELSHWEGV